MAVFSKAHRQRPRPKPGAWFVPVRGSYLPATMAGWLSYIPFIAYLMLVGIIADHNTASLALAILLIVPNWVAAAVVLTWFAARKS